MKHKFFTISLIVGLALAASAGSAAGQPGSNNASSDQQMPLAIEATVTSKISYQGVLRENGALVSGARNLVFEFWDNAACIGSSPSFSVSKPGVAISNGLFSVALEMPARFSGVAYWLRVRVGSTALGCQELLPVPYALTLRPGATISASYTALNLESSSGNALVATTSTTGGGPTAVGVVGKSTATTGGWAGVMGEVASRSDWTVGVLGRATATSGITSGVWGQTESTANGARGVTGWAHGVSGATTGVRGDSESPAGTGVAGFSNATTGSTYGVYGETMSHSDWTVAVWGNARGQSGVTTGVWGTTNSSTGGARGVMGYASATAGETYAIVGENASPSGWAAAFNSAGNGVWIGTTRGREALGVNLGDVVVDEGNLAVGGNVTVGGNSSVGGSKSAVVPTEDGSRLLYTEESAEVWFTDYGFSSLVDGTAQVVIDPIFAQTVNLDQPYHVFVQVYGDADVYVTNRTAAGFAVRLREGDPTSEFSYRIVAKRRGFEDQRLEPAPWADNGFYLHSQQQMSAPNLVPPLMPNMP